MPSRGKQDEGGERRAAQRARVLASASQATAVVSPRRSRVQRVADERERARRRETPSGTSGRDANQSTRRHSPDLRAGGDELKPGIRERPPCTPAGERDRRDERDARTSRADPATTRRRPPRPIAASTTASIRLAASVVLSTYIDRNRNHTTSSASSVPPERNAQTSIARRSPRAETVVAMPRGAAARHEAPRHSSVAADRRPPGSGRTRSRPLPDVEQRRDPRGAADTPASGSARLRRAITPATAPSVFQP